VKSDQVFLWHLFFITPITPGFYVEKQRSARTLFYFFTELRFTLDLTGKAEASSAGEQLARNNLFDWNGQKRLG
jgi:hypothetical protein